jgi:hypothetical protein
MTALGPSLSDPFSLRNKPLTRLRAVADCAPGASTTLRRAKARPATAGESAVAVHPLPLGEGYDSDFYPPCPAKDAAHAEPQGRGLRFPPLPPCPAEDMGKDQPLRRGQPHFSLDNLEKIG